MIKAKGLGLELGLELTGPFTSVKWQIINIFNNPHDQMLVQLCNNGTLPRLLFNFAFIYLIINRDADLVKVQTLMT